MSTRSIVARVGEHEGKFSGRYVHSDGMPTSMGAELWKLYHGFFKRDLNKMLTYLIDAEHAQAGWSGIVGKDFKLKPGYTWQKAIKDGAKWEVYSKRADYLRPQCFAGRPGEEPCLFTETDIEQGTDIEWVYAFDEVEHKMYIRDVAAKEDVAAIDLNAGGKWCVVKDNGQQVGDSFPDRETAALLRDSLRILNGGIKYRVQKVKPPNWVAIECGTNFERCSHYAWKHNLVPKTCNLSTQTWLGNRPLEMRDAVAVEVKGKLLKLTGSGGDSDFLNRANLNMGRYAQFPSGTWVATCVYGNGRRVELPIAKRTQQGDVPLPGVTWIFPALNDQPASRRVG